MVVPIPRRNILSALTGDDDRNQVPTIAQQKIAKQAAEQRRIMEQKLEPLSDRRNLLIEKLLRINESVKQDDVNIHLLRLHLDTLRRCSDEYEKIHSEMSVIIPKENREEHRQEYVKFERMHDQLYVVVQTKIAKFGEAEAKPPSAVVPAVPQPVYVQAPAPQLHAPFPRFNGDPVNWYSFKSLFQSIMSKYPQETPAMKILHLRNSLDGDAKDKIDQEVINSNDYSLAWNILENAYEDKRLIMDTHIDAILDIPKVTKDNRGKSITKLVDICTKHTEALSSHGFKVEGLAELLLVNVLYKKLDRETQEQWELELGAGDLPVFSEFMDFLRERGRVLVRTSHSQHQGPQQGAVQSQSKQRQPFSQRPTSQNASKSFVQTTKESCPCCKSDHSIYRCPKFQNQSTSERKSVVTKSNLCYNCLKGNHRVLDCPSDHVCKVQGCGRKHHSLLHPSNNTDGSTATKSTKVADPKTNQQQTVPDRAQPEDTIVPDAPSANTLCGHTVAVKRHVLLSTAEVFVTGYGGSTIKSRALLDSGSDSHIITERLASQLKLKLERIDLPINGLNDIQTNVKHLVSTTIRSRFGTKSRYDLDFLVVPRVTSNIPAVEIDVSSLSLPSTLPLADSSFHTPGEIDLILGNEIFFDLVKGGRVKLGNSSAVLVETELGWVVAGSVHTRNPKQFSRVCQFNRFEEELNRTLTKFWEVESVPSEGMLTKTETDVEEHFNQTHNRDEQGRYQVRLPFNELKDRLGDSYELAKKRFDRLKVALDRNPDKREQYEQFMAEYEQLGHMKEVESVDEKGYYIPHHAVYKATSSTTKTRVVFDASAKTTSGVSLNDTISVGPTVQSDLLTIILRFCTHEVVLTADIPKMYRQIRMYPEDCRFQRILWRNANGEERTFELQTVTYGVASSPHHATRALMQLTRDEGQEFPLAANVIEKDSYIDDFLTGGESVETVITVYHQLSALLAKGGFGVHKFCSNSPDVLNVIPEHLHEKQVNFEEGGVNDTIKALGLIWNPTDDYFGFHVNRSENRISTTKRTVLSDIGRLFDPLGFLGPIMTTAKLLMQDVWRIGLDWDEALPDELLQSWRSFQEQLPSVNQIRKRRLVIPAGSRRVELHGFSDASMRAYGAVLYIRSIAEDGSVNVDLVASKSRVAPLKSLTIPRLELCGARLLAELTGKVVSAMNVQFDEVKLWCDSQIVLCWLKKSPAALNVFVANRVAAILESTNIHQWQYVRSECNPADVISRGEYPENLLQNKLWWTGSPLLWQPYVKATAPEPLDESAIPELKQAKVLTTTSAKPNDQFNRMSHYRKLLRAWVYVRRFLTPRRTHPLSTPITADEVFVAESAVIRMLQEEVFGDLLRTLQHTPVKRHNLSNLAPFVAEDGLIRVGGRLKYSAIPYDGKHQVLLPEKHHLTVILLRRLHEDHSHVGPNGLLAIVRERYWPLRAKTAIKKIIASCQLCAKHRPVLGSQLMGNLPEPRVNPAPVFSKVGVDYAGPFQLRLSLRSPKTYKAYVLVFICMAVKAIHMELVSSLTTEHFIAALHRFASRRGLPSDVFSDNGTSFVGANHELAALRELFEEEQHRRKLAEFCSSKGIRWHFIPPRSPHFGGVWEAGVKSMKFHFKRVIGETRLTYEEMTTFLAQTEAILNSRPLCPLSDDPNDTTVLTPSHFLIGRSAVALPEPSYTDEKVGRLSRYEHLQQMMQHLWGRWSSEYLHHLQTRQKWHTGDVKHFKVGALVLLLDENLPPQQWRRGRIIATHPGGDGAIRVVTVKTTSGEFKRSVTKIAVLPSVESADSTGGE